MSWKRRIGMLAIVVAMGLLVFAGLAVLLVQTSWFYGKVRVRIVKTVEDATGGRVEIGAFQFDWRQMRAEVTGFTLHGTEPADKPPLFHADKVTVGLKIISILERSVDIKSLDVTAPQVYLNIDAEGRTNIPEPKQKAKQSESTLQALLDLKIGRFTVENGLFEVEGHGKTPFAARGRNLKASVQYRKDALGPHYPFDLSVDPLDAQLGSYTPLPLGVTVAATLETNRIAIRALKLTSGGSQIAGSGAIENFDSPHGSFRYDAHVTVAEATRVLRIPELQRGAVQVTGVANWTGPAKFSVTGKVHALGLDYTDSTVRLRGFSAEGSLDAGPKAVNLNRLEISGKYVTGLQQEQVDGRIANAVLRGRDLTLHEIALAAFGGSFHGDATVRDLTQYSVTGEIAGMAARQVVAMYSKERLPWDALASGPVHVDGSFQNSVELRATAGLTIVPAPESAAVHGQVNAAYTADGGILDLGRSSVTLPSSRVDFSGALGQQMRIHLETRDLDDLLPALGTTAASLPAKLHGSVVFDGTATGAIDNPHIAGHARLTRVEYAGQTFDSVECDAEVSPENLRLQNATAAHGPLRAQFQLTMGIHQWNADDDTKLTATGSVRNAPLAELAQLLDIPELPVDATVAATGQLTGTVGDPQVSADTTLTRGTVNGEPFDRMTGHLNYSASLIELTGTQVAAGRKQVTLSAAYRHEPGHFKAGRVHFQVATNAMPLDQIQTLQGQLSGAKGTAQASLTGDIDVSPDAQDNEVYRLAALSGNIAGHALQVGDQALGDATLNVSSQGAQLRAHLESNAANSLIRGDGEWRMEGDYPGTATVDFSKLDLAELHQWLSPASAGTSEPFVGSAEAQLHIDGPAMKWQSLKAELRIPVFEIGPSPSQGLPGGVGVLKNSGPIVATLANDVVTLENARLVGRSTDLAISGKLQLHEKTSLDARVNGHVDLALLHELNPDFESSGVVTTNATVRGVLQNPQVTGRMDFQDATFNIVDVPNGISKANGVLIFTTERATIQSFTGETGGGQIELTGFMGYGRGPAIYQLHARAHEVRVRYPEGVSTVANANLNFSGSTDRSTLTGAVTIVRTAFNPQSDFSSLLAKSSQPVQTPSARTGVLGGLNFDVQINTAPNIQFQSSLTQDIQMEANLRLKGTFSNPAILGRVNITQGQVFFFGTRYNLTQGSIAFFNPVRIDPIVDIDLETKARGIDVTLNISGSFDKPNLTPRSDPPLQFNEIVALLATGRTPTSDPTLLTQQSTAPQSWQQMGASALLGQAIASPVAGRLQRFFGVSQLRIDPTLPGVENNPQARLTLEQQVTPDITFTYITDVTTSNPQVVRVEWAFAKQWSVVALREENGLFGLDFFFKKRF